MVVVFLAGSVPHLSKRSEEEQSLENIAILSLTLASLLASWLREVYENLGRQLDQPAGSRGGRRVGGSGIFSTASQGVSTPSGGCRGHVGRGVSSFDRLLSSVSLLLTRSINKINDGMTFLKKKISMAKSLVRRL